MVERRITAEIKDLQGLALQAKEAADKRWQNNRVLRYINRLSEFMDTRAGTGISIGLILGLAVISVFSQEMDGFGKFVSDLLPEVSGGLGGIMLGKSLKVTTLYERRIRTNTVEDIRAGAVTTPRDLVRSLILHEDVPPVSEVTRWVAGDVKGEHKEDPRFPLAFSLSEAFYKKEKPRFPKAKDARLSARLKAKKLFWEGVLLAQEIRSKTSYIMEKALRGGADLTTGVGVGVLVGEAIGTIAQDRGFAALGGLIDDAWVAGLILIRPNLKRISDLLSYPTVRKPKVHSGEVEMYSPRGSHDFPKQNHKPVIGDRHIISRRN